MKTQNMNKILSAVLIVTMALPMTTINAASASLPEPLAVYDFESGIDGILEADVNAAIVNSETVYVRKSAEQLAEGEKLDANGLVYTGSGSEAKYATVDVIGAPTVIEDEEQGKVLQFDDTTMKVDRFQKKSSASVENDEEATAALDRQLLQRDYYYVEAVDKICPSCGGANVGEATKCVHCEGAMVKTALDTQSIAPALKVSNPFGGLTEYFTEYDELEDVKTKKYGTKYSPLWTKGVTISYRVKSAVDEDGKYEPSSVLRWENDNEYYYQADAYAKYLTCKKFDVNYAKMSEEEKELAFTKSPSGVFLYKNEETGAFEDADGLLDYYFEYLPGYYEYDANGKIVPILYEDENGTKAPVYNYALIEEMNNSGRGSFDGTGRFYFSNPNYQRGFQQNSDGSFSLMYHDAYYNKGYNNIARLHAGLADGELQIDVDNSIFWVADSKSGLQNGDVFFMNSWQESAIIEGTGGTYESAEFVALSPVSDAFNHKHANAGQWHHVAITMQNDWVEFYVDGEFVDVYTNYSSRGAVTIDTSKSFKRFNKGAGMRYGFGSVKQMGNIFYGNYVCRLFMDWLSDENSYLNFGGIGNCAEDYAQAYSASKACLDDVYFFDELLNEEQINMLAGKIIPDPIVRGDGDADGNGAVTLDDAQIVLLLALGIETTGADAEAADVDGIKGITLDDAQLVLRKALGID